MSCYFFCCFLYRNNCVFTVHLQFTNNSQWSPAVSFHACCRKSKTPGKKTSGKKKWPKRGSATPKVFTFLFQHGPFAVCAAGGVCEKRNRQRKSAQPLAQRHAAAAIPVALHRASKVNNPLNTASMWFTGGLPFTHAALRCEQLYLKNCLHLLGRDSVPKHLERTVQLQRGQWGNKQKEIAERVNTLLIPGQGVIRTLIYWILNPSGSRGLAPTVSWLAWIQCWWWADLVSHRLEQWQVCGQRWNQTSQMFKHDRRP